MDRSLISKKILANALEELIAVKSIDAITVNDIIRRADVSRTTFYRHFEDKFALMNWIFGQYMDELAASYQNTPTYRLLLIKLFTFFQAKRAFFSRIINYLGQTPTTSFYRYFLERMTSLLSIYFHEHMKGKTLSAKDEYMIHYHCNGILRSAFDWLSAGTPESPEELADIMLEIVSGKHPAYSLPFFCDDISGDIGRER